MRYVSLLFATAVMVSVQSVHAQTKSPVIDKPKPSDTVSLSNSSARAANALAVEEVVFVWNDANSAGSCTINGGATLTLRSDGTASWNAQVKSSSSDDAYCVTMSFFDRNNLNLFNWPRFCSQTLTDSFQRWTNFDLAFPQAHFPFVTHISRVDHC